MNLGPSPEQLLSWVPEFMKLGGRRVRSQAPLLGYSMLVGLVAGGGAVVFYLATAAVSHLALGDLAGYWPEPHPAGEPQLAWLVPQVAVLRPWLLLLLPIIGGLLSGWLVFTIAPEAEGHGTDAVIAAYHQREGYIRPRVPLVKIVASALTIGTGGSGGREGPIAQIGAGFGSLLGRLLKLPPRDRRVLAAAGMCAGIAAIFRAPLAGALFASEVLYWSPEFEPEVIMPAGIASVIAYCTFGAVFGWQPLFATPDLTFTNPYQLGAYLFLALCMVVLAVIYTRTFYGITRFFHGLTVSRKLRPAIGAGASALVGLALYHGFGRDQRVLSVLSFGYGSLQNAMSNEFSVGAAVLLAIAFGKILTTSLTIGSGGSGGVFGPSMVIGGCGGGAVGLLLHQLWPELVPHPASFVLMGMAGFFAAAAKTPFSTLIIVTEMTGGYHLLLPALWVCVLAFMLSDKQSLYSNQLESRAQSPAHRGTLLRQTVSDPGIRAFIRASVPALLLHPADSLEAVVGRFAQSRFAVLPVVDDEQRLLGTINLEEVVGASNEPTRPLVARDLMRADVSPLLTGDTVLTAQEAFVAHDVMALPVVDTLEDRAVVGLVKRFDVASAYLSMMQGAPAPRKVGEGRARSDAPPSRRSRLPSESSR